MASVSVLDVGHANCAVLQDERGVVIIDAGWGETLLEFLEQQGIEVIDAILISHADADHIAGVLALLTERRILVRTIYLNAEPSRQTQLWAALRVAVQDARARGEVRVHVELTTESTAVFERGDTNLEILSPTPEIAMSGAGGTDLQGQPLSANAMSVVIRIVSNGTPALLLTGDMDDAGLERLLTEIPEPRARTLVFPHHGGRPGRGSAFAFAERLSRAVQPNVVIFSIGRGKHGTPLPEIILGVRAGAPAVHIVCTQLSERCAAVAPAHVSPHLGDRVARGRASRSCCAGTFTMVLSETDPAFTPALVAHGAFVERHAPTALCLGRHVGKTGTP